MTHIGPLDPSAPPRAAAQRTIFRLLLIQSGATAVLLLGVLAAFAGVDQRSLILIGVLAVLGVAAWLSAWLSHRAAGTEVQSAPNAAPNRAGKTPSAASGPSVGVPQGRLEAVLHNLPWAVWITDGNGRILHHNTLAVELFESGKSDLRGQSVETWWTRWAGQDTWPDVLRALKDGTRWEGELELATRDQRTPQFEITAVPLETHSDAQAMLFLAEDVTELRALGQVLIDLERLSSRGQMAGEVAHEINNFLTILGGNLDIIPRLLAAGDHDKVATKFVAMRGALDKIARFSDGLMGHREDLEPGPCDLNRQIETLLAFLKPQNRFDGVELVYRSRPDLPPVAGRAAQFQQVLVNLLNNAADAIHQGGRREGRIEVTAQTLPGQAGLAVTVKDNGPGLSKSASAHIFRERFSDKESGHGLGLLNCHAIARNLGGTLTAESLEGRGTAFTLTVPCLAEGTSASRSTPASTLG